MKRASRMTWFFYSEPSVFFGFHFMTGIVHFYGLSMSGSSVDCQKATFSDSLILSAHDWKPLSLTVRDRGFLPVSADYICRLPKTEKWVRIRNNPTKSFAIRFSGKSAKSGIIHWFCAMRRKKPVRKGHFLTGFGRGDRIWTCDLLVPKSEHMFCFVRFC